MKNITKILCSTLFVVSLATAQSLPAGSPTDLQVAHVTQNKCAQILDIILRIGCQQQVDVRVASSNPDVSAFAVALLYVDKFGALQVKVQLTNHREASSSPYFTCAFTDVDDIVIKSVEAMPLFSDSSRAAVINNIP